MTPQTITSPAGEEMIVIPKAEYDALVQAAKARADEAAEDTADAAMYLARKTALISQAHGALPAEVTAAILTGEKSRAAIRKWRKLTQIELAEKIGISQGTLSDIESGRRAPSDEVAEKMAQALNVPKAWID
jgi:DNA-binding XRE family transcriptional regulator